MKLETMSNILIVLLAGFAIYWIYYMQKPSTEASKLDYITGAVVLGSLGLNIMLRAR